MTVTPIDQTPPVVTLEGLVVTLAAELAELRARVERLERASGGK